MCPGLPMRWLSQTLRCSGQPRPAMAIAAKIDQNPTKIDPRSTQNRPKIDPKSTQIGQKSSLDGSRRPFGLQGGSGSRLDPETRIRWTPWAPQVGSQNWPKIVKKSIPNSTCFSITFLIDFGTLLGPIWSDFGSQNGAKIGPESVPRAIMKQMQRSSKSSAGAVFLRIRGPWNRSKIALKTMLS